MKMMAMRITLNIRGAAEFPFVCEVMQWVLWAQVLVVDAVT